MKVFRRPQAKLGRIRSVGARRPNPRDELTVYGWSARSFLGAAGAFGVPAARRFYLPVIPGERRAQRDAREGDPVSARLRAE